MALAGLAGAISHLFPDVVKRFLDPSGIFSDLFQEANFDGAHGSSVDRSSLPAWAQKEQYQSGFPAWIQIVLVLAAVIPIIYLLVSNKKPKVFLKPQEWQELKLAEKEVVSHNVRRFRFALPEANMVLGLPVGSHISISAAGKAVMRPYTPVTDDNLRGAVEFVIKLYPEGKMSQCLERLSVGDALQFKGPRGRFQYRPNMKKALGMVAGGSGITPMFQVCQAILRNPYDSTKLFLVYANRAEEDILLREKLDEWAKKERARFKVYYVLELPPAEWQGGKGYVSPDIVHEHLPLPNPEVLILRCGPPPMNKAVGAMLDKAGFSEDMQFEF